LPDKFQRSTKEVGASRRDVSSSHEFNQLIGCKSTDWGVPLIDEAKRRGRVTDGAPGVLNRRKSHAANKKKKKPFRLN
jgi:hypothetical protein